jgi:hypothetical protein
VLSLQARWMSSELMKEASLAVDEATEQEAMHRRPDPRLLLTGLARGEACGCRTRRNGGSNRPQDVLLRSVYRESRAQVELPKFQCCCGLYGSMPSWSFGPRGRSAGAGAATAPAGVTAFVLDWQRSIVCRW